MAESQEAVSSSGTAGPMCANGCGFFGSAATKNLCSMCYKDHLIKTADTAAAPAVVATAAKPGPPAPPAEKENGGGGPVETQKQKSSSAAAIDCANGCGFFGSAATKNLCSGCYRDFLKNVPTAPALAADKVVLTSEQQPAAHISAAATSSSTAPAVEEAPAVNAAAPNRCASCRKKVGLLGLPCRCGRVFCALHLHAEKHACDFDFKAAGREKIAKNNPLVVAAKIDKI